MEDINKSSEFNPNNHLIKLQGKDYLEVKWRMLWFRRVCPHGTIDTEELEVDLDREMEEEVSVWNPDKRRTEKVTKRAKGYARMKAVVTDGKGGRATGTKSENAANFSDFVEKAETGAIGRALAALGYGTQFAPEFDEGERIVDSPVDRSNASGTGQASSAPPAPSAPSSPVETSHALIASTPPMPLRTVPSTAPDALSDEQRGQMRAALNAFPSDERTAFLHQYLPDLSRKSADWTLADYQAFVDGRQDWEAQGKASWLSNAIATYAKRKDLFLPTDFTELRDRITGVPGKRVKDMTLEEQASFNRMLTDAYFYAEMARLLEVTLPSGSILTTYATTQEEQVQKRDFYKRLLREMFADASPAQRSACQQQFGPRLVQEQFVSKETPQTQAS